MGRTPGLHPSQGVVERPRVSELSSVVPFVSCNVSEDTFGDNDNIDLLCDTMVPDYANVAITNVELLNEILVPDDSFHGDVVFHDTSFDNNNEFDLLHVGFLPDSPPIPLINNADNFLGGKIGLYSHVWFQFSSCRWTRDTLAGRLLEFQEPPGRSSVRPLRLSSRDQRALDTALVGYERCGIIEVVKDPGELSYVSNVFPVLKRDGLSARVILNLKSLNPFIRYQHFRMDSLSSVLPLISQYCWFASLDLMNAYFSVPVSVADRSWLRFWWYDRLYQYTCLPQGLTSAPRIFTRLLKPIMGHLRAVGITAVIYIDDCLIIASSEGELLDHVRYACRLF